MYRSHAGVWPESCWAAAYSALEYPHVSVLTCKTLGVPPSVEITRLVVDEGFLDGLDLRFGPGLNVLIGPRGVGKTSIIQLLRFCLGVPAFGGAFSESALSHAREVLGADGRVSVELMIDGEPIVLSRRKQDEAPEGPVDAVGEPIILAQTEVEEIAVDPGGRGSRSEALVRYARSASASVPAEVRRSPRSPSRASSWCSAGIC